MAINLLDLIAINLIRDTERATGRRPGTKQIAHAIGVGRARAYARLRELENAAAISPRPKAVKKKKDPIATARYLAGKRRRAAVKERAKEKSSAATLG